MPTQFDIARSILLLSFAAALLIAVTRSKALANPPKQYGVSLVADIQPGPVSSIPDYLTVYNDGIYFRANDPRFGSELFRYDGQALSRVSDINQGFGDSFPSDLAVLNNKLYFSAQGPPNIGDELFFYDGAAIGLVEDLNPGFFGSHPSELTAYGDELIFKARVGRSATPEELGIYRFDGTEISRIESAGGTFAHQFTAIDGLLYFRGSGLELFAYNGQSVTPIDGINPNGASNPLWMASFRGDVYFHANDGENGAELFKYDGNSISPVADINEGSAGSVPLFLTEFNGRLFFSADNGANGYELFQYDGDSVSLVDDINPGPAPSNPRHFFQFDEQLFFQAHNELTGSELYSYDGVSVRRITDLNPGPANSLSGAVRVFAELNGQLYFSATDGRHGEELFRLFLVPEPNTLIGSLLVCLVAACFDFYPRMRFRSASNRWF